MAGETVIDSRRAKMLHQHGVLARYFVPREDVRFDLLGGVEPISPPAGAPGLDDHVAFAWDDLDAWFEEDEQLIAHAIDPYHRVDVRRTSRHLVVSVDDVVLADTQRACALFETGLPTRWYVPREHVLVDLEPSDLRTECAYKGVASYFSTGLATTCSRTSPGAIRSRATTRRRSRISSASSTSRSISTSTESAKSARRRRGRCPAGGAAIRKCAERPPARRRGVPGKATPGRRQYVRRRVGALSHGT